ncbi:OLC1v1012375C1 [Oldenlandia corymbosa var. corymbosa]|uniref:OLC1v1012375C1 n=1 Tax=Oldenlandia corymbosa var. corymbosa TaxID=529605 RepID=A0AAV1DY88_OLDCO|nr:OLC1v1012375C1 [Oldenlandia corymbosa var. corymbosa]
MAGERRDANTMSVELAIQRELAYRKMVAGSLSQQEINNLLPLKAPDSSINCDRESELEKDGWKLVRIDEEGEGIPFRSSNSGQASMQALERTQPKMQAEKGKSVSPLTLSIALRLM